jgi:dihydropyrimidinase
MSGVPIRGGAVVNTDTSIQADVFCEGGLIHAIGRGLDVPAGTSVLDGSAAWTHAVTDKALGK